MKRQRAGPLITEEMIVFAEGLYTACPPAQAGPASLLISQQAAVVFLFSAQAGGVYPVQPQGWIPCAWVLRPHRGPRPGSQVRAGSSSIRSFIHSFIQHAWIKHLSCTAHSANSPVPTLTWKQSLPLTLLEGLVPDASGQTYGLMLILCGPLIMHLVTICPEPSTLILN